MSASQGFWNLRIPFPLPNETLARKSLHGRPHFLASPESHLGPNGRKSSFVCRWCRGVCDGHTGRYPEQVQPGNEVGFAGCFLASVACRCQGDCNGDCKGDVRPFPQPHSNRNGGAPSRWSGAKTAKRPSSRGQKH